jgi:hypothetical protein
MTEERDATLDELIEEVSRPLWRVAARAQLAKLEAERDRYKGALERITNAPHSLSPVNARVCTAGCGRCIAEASLHGSEKSHE